MPTLRVELALDFEADLDPAALRPLVAERLAVPTEAIGALRVRKKALDARRRLPRPFWRLTVDAESSAPASAAHARPVEAEAPRLVSPRARPGGPPVVVVGAGPAGLFAAWHLAEQGARVTLLERGKAVEHRARDFGRFRGKGELDPESNLCFGEGGAGTYSDGKLTTRVKDPLVREVFERLVEVGAPPSILVDAKPHIGTNLLFRLLQRLRARLLELGVEVRFGTRLEGLHLVGPRVAGVATGQGTIEAPRVVLAIGHSARETFRRLVEQGVPVEPKPFAVGVRIEHPQSLIDRAQYRLGPPRPTALPPADYRLTHEVSGRGVYSFCMCPGGMIVPTAAEPNTVVVNGMSTAKRSSPFANSGLVVQVQLDDLPGHDPLRGVEFQRKLEAAAFAAGGERYFAPAMLAKDLLAGRASGRLADSHFRPGLAASDLRDVLPPFVWRGLQGGLQRFARQLEGFAGPHVNLIAVETKTSSPIRVPRDPERLEVAAWPGLYVAGEGPGYAGGIASAAVDGLRVAQQILRELA